MNKVIIFFAGLLTGAAAGASAAYLILHDHLVKEAEDEIDRYAEHCEERIASIRAKYAGEKPKEDEDETFVHVTLNDDVDELDDRNEALIRRNAGVKKYHHQNEYIGGESNVNSIFADKEEEKVTTKEINNTSNIEDDPMIEEIDEDTFENDQGYSKEMIDFDYPEEKGYWGYGTDNELTVHEKFGKDMFGLIGEASRWLSDYIDENTGFGEAYFRNKHMMTDFHVVVHGDED